MFKELVNTALTS